MDKINQIQNRTTEGNPPTGTGCTKERFSQPPSKVALLSMPLSQSPKTWTTNWVGSVANGRTLNVNGIDTFSSVGLYITKFAEQE